MAAKAGLAVRFLVFSIKTYSFKGNHNFMGLTFNLPVEIPWIVRFLARSIEVDITAKVNPSESGEMAAACLNARAPMVY